MANPCETIEEVGHLASELVPVLVGMLAETGTLSEVWSSVRSATLAETGTLSEVWTPVNLAVLDEEGTLSEQYVQLAHGSALLSDTGRLGEDWQIRREVTLADTGTLSETWAPARSVTMEETGTLADAVLPYRTVSAVLSDTGRLSEAWQAWRTGTLSETLHVSEAWSTARTMTLSDTGTLSELWQASRQAFAMLAETGRLGDVWSYNVRPQATLADEGLLADRWLPPGDGTDAWTANTDTWAMSRYEGFGVNALAEVGGVLYGSGAQGLYKMTANDDSGTAIDAAILTGLDDFGSEQVKRMRTMYAAARTDGQLQVDVRDVSYGAVAWHTFPFEVRGGAAMAPQRAKLARGMRSRYWQFRLRNVSGADLALDGLSIIADIGSRRV